MLKYRASSAESGSRLQDQSHLRKGDSISSRNALLRGVAAEELRLVVVRRSELRGARGLRATTSRGDEAAWRRECVRYASIAQ